MVSDGSLLGIDLVSGGFGYQYPPQVSMLDPTGIGAGAVIRAGIASTATVYQTYEDEEDFEDYFKNMCSSKCRVWKCVCGWKEYRNMES